MKSKFRLVFALVFISSWMKKGHELSRAELKNLGSDSSLVSQIRTAHFDYPWKQEKKEEKYLGLFIYFHVSTYLLDY